MNSPVPESPGLATAALDATSGPIGQGRLVYLHCRWGIGRTGAMIGSRLVRHGHTDPEPPGP